MGEVSEIKTRRFRELKRKDVIMLVKDGDRWVVDHWLTDGVAPSSSYSTAQEAAARACQLLRLRNPVTPQSWPEIGQIGGDGTGSPPRHS